MGKHEVLWKSWKEAVSSQATLTNVQKDKATTVFTMSDGKHPPWVLSLPRYRRYSLGLDIVGFTKRSPEGQLYLAAALLVAVDAARDLLRSIHWLGTNEPDVAIPLGDGAILLFETWEQAIAMMFAINMFIEDMNRGSTGGIDRKVDAEHHILPWEVRYAVALGDVGKISAEGRPNAIGPGVSNCARILSASKGAHLLIQDEVMRQLNEVGGINELQGPCAWSQELHAARLPDRQVKSETFGFYNVFGAYTSEKLLAARKEAQAKKRNISKGERDPGRRYAIGSHDVATIPG